MNFTTIARVAGFTFFQAACSTVLALIIGTAAAFFCGRRNFPGKKLLLSLSVVPFCIPSLIIALGYVTFLGLNGGLNQFLMFIFRKEEPPVKILYSFAGLILCHGFYNFPLVMKTVAQGWERIPESQAESARLLGAGEGRIFRTVTFFWLLPAAGSAALLVFIYCFLSFIMVLLFGGIGNTTLEVEIYKSARALLDFKRAGLLSVIETSILVLVTALYGFVEYKNSRTRGFTQINSGKKIRGTVESFSFAAVITVIVIFFILPLLGIAYNAFTSSRTGGRLTMATFRQVVAMRSFWPSVRFTFITGISTGFLCAVLGFVYSVFLRFMEMKKSSRFIVVLKSLPMLPMCVSSVTCGVIIMAVMGHGNMGSLILTQVFLTWPLAWRTIQPAISRISSETLESARLLSRNVMDTAVRVFLPSGMKAFISAFGFCFAVSAGDTTLPLVLSIPHFDTLSLFTYRLAGAYRFNEACAAGVILGILCAGIFAVSERIAEGGKNNGLF